MTELSEYEARANPGHSPCDECESPATKYGSLPGSRVGIEEPWRTCDVHVPDGAPWSEPIVGASVE